MKSYCDFRTATLMSSVGEVDYSTPEAFRLAPAITGTPVFDATKEEACRRMSLNTVTQQRVKVLIVDDNDDQRHLLRRHFEIAGCDVTDAATAESAISVYGTAKPDLAVIDLMLPGMDGWELSERLYAEAPDCPVAISSVLDLESYPPTRTALPKPVTRASVREVLINCVPRWIAP